jgi:hypothetical protein
VNLGTVYRKASFVRESRGSVPGLNLISEDDLYFPFVWPTSFDPWLHDVVDGYRKLPAGKDCSDRGVLLTNDRHLKGQT